MVDVGEAPPVGPVPEKRPADYYTYKLVGIVVHSGTAVGGHYYSFIDSNRSADQKGAGPEKDRWLEFNDSVVKDFDFHRVPAECFGGAVGDSSLMQDAGEGRSRSAYMLIYERRLKGTIPELVPRSEIEEGDLVLSSREDCEKEMRQAGNARLMFYSDPATNETFVLHDFYCVPQQTSEAAMTVLDLLRLTRRS